MPWISLKDAKTKSTGSDLQSKGIAVYLYIILRERVNWKIGKRDIFTVECVVRWFFKDTFIGSAKQSGVSAEQACSRTSLFASMLITEHCVIDKLLFIE